MPRTFVPSLIASALALAGVAQTAGPTACRPRFTVTDVQFSEMIPPTLERSNRDGGCVTVCAECI